jgi:sigma-B regulation protein RsbU (phosphoserine phosphatase)
MTLTRRVFVAFLLGFLVLAGGISTMGWMREKVLSRQADDLLLTWYEHAWREGVDRHDLALRARVTPFIAAETGLGAAIAERRFPELRSELAQLFGKLAANTGATALQLVDVQSRILYTTSLASLDQSEPLLDPDAVIAGLVGTAQPAGVERHGGALYQVAGFPVMSNLQIVGLLMVGIDARALVQDVSAETGSGLALTDADGKPLVMGGIATPDLLARMTGTGRGAQAMQMGDQSRTVATLPLTNAGGTRIGLQRWFADSTEQRWDTRQLKWETYAADVALLGLLLVLAAVYLGRTFRPVGTTMQALRALAHGDTSVEIIGSDRDSEFGGTAQALRVFRDSQIAVALVGERRARQRRRQLMFIRGQMERMAATLDETAREELLADLKRIEARATEQAEGQGDALDALAVAFQTMTERVSRQHESMSKLVAELREAVKAKQQVEHLKEQLAVVTRMQSDMLPRGFPPRPEIAIRGELLQGESFGGDFYDFFMLDAHRVALFGGNVAGEGLPAAFLTITARALVHALAPTSASPAACLARMSELLIGDNESLLEVQAFLAILDLRSGLVVMSCASYPLPLLSVRPGEVQQVVCNLGQPLALTPQVTLEDTSMELPARSTLLMFSPGVPRIELGGRPIGADGMVQLLKDCDDLGADAVTDRLHVRLTAGEVRRTGDASFVVLRYQGS